MTGKDDRKSAKGAPRREVAIEEAKTIHFLSLGCPKNRVDTEVMLRTVKGSVRAVCPASANSPRCAACT